MEMFMKENGKMIKKMEMENILLQMKMFMKVNIKMIRETEMENLYRKIDQFMKETGIKI